MAQIEKPSNLVPIEEEVVGKSWADLLTLAKEYRFRAYSLFRAGHLPPDSREQYSELMYHAGGIEHEAKLLRTHEILRNPHATEEDKKFARFVIWNYKFNVQLEMRLPPNPDEQTIRHAVTTLLQELPPPDGMHLTVDNFQSADFQS